MGKAYDAMFAISKLLGPIKRNLSRFAVVFSLFFFSFSLFAKQLEERDVPKVMSLFLEYHIESKSITSSILHRMVKNYIEMFDGEKSYLLKNEVMPFLSLSDQKSERVIQELKEGNYSFFYQLDAQFTRAIQRARVSRTFLKTVLMSQLEDPKARKINRSEYAESEKELFLRQKNTLINFYIVQNKKRDLSSSQQKGKLFTLFEKRMSRFENEYLLKTKNLKEHYFVLHILKAFARSLDAHTAFFSEEEAQEMRVSLEKQFEGIGVVLMESVEGVMITDLISNSPAKRSGQIQVGDIIVQINRQSVENLAFEEVLKILKNRDREIILGLRRGEKSQFFSVTLTSAPISMEEESLTYSYEEVEGGIIGKLILKSFYENDSGRSSEREIKAAIVELKKKGTLKGLILDLRENSGGFLSQAIKVASLFIENGVVVVSKYGQELKYMRKVEGQPEFKGPLVVLTSKLSASASEIVAQALQDYGVALIVGDEKTLGKGSIQYQTVTAEKSDYYYKVTIGKYYTVSGRSTQINGVKADIVVPSIYAPYEIGERFLEYALSADSIRPAYSDSLADLEPRLKALLEKKYLPNLQRKELFWQKHLSVLKTNSVKRMVNDEHFKRLLTGEEREFTFSFDDCQMQEATHILQDMIPMWEEYLSQKLAAS